MPLSGSEPIRNLFANDDQVKYRRIGTISGPA